MKAQTKKPERGMVGRSPLSTFSRKSPDVVSDFSPGTDLENSALHPDRYNLANIPVSAKPLENNQRGIAHGLTSKLPVQAKLTIGQPNDKYEQEADRVAEQVVQQIDRPTVKSNPLQKVQGKVIPSEVKNDTLQLQSLTHHESSATIARPDLESSIQQLRGKGQPLADSIRQPMEKGLETDFSKIRVHTDSESDSLTRQIGAYACTSKQDIFFRSGNYNPSTKKGQRLLAHELAHTVQQQKSIGKLSLNSQSNTTSPTVLQAKFVPEDIVDTDDEGDIVIVGTQFKWEAEDGSKSKETYAYVGQPASTGGKTVFMDKETKKFYKQFGKKRVEVKISDPQELKELLQAAEKNLGIRIGSGGMGSRAENVPGTIHYLEGSKTVERMQKKLRPEITYKKSSKEEFEKMEKEPDFKRSGSAVWKPDSGFTPMQVEPNATIEGDPKFLTEKVTHLKRQEATARYRSNPFEEMQSSSFSSTNTSPAMSNWNAYTYAVKKGFDDKSKPKYNWEWLHIRGKQLGGDYHKDNLVAGTYDANSEMIPLENEICRFAKVVAKDPVAKLNIVFEATVMDDTHVGKEITLSWYTSKMNDLGNSEQLKNDDTKLKNSGSAKFSCIRTTPYAVGEKAIDITNLRPKRRSGS